MNVNIGKPCVLVINICAAMRIGPGRTAFGATPRYDFATGGGKCAVDSEDTPMYCNATDGTSPGTMFSFFSANSLQVDKLDPGSEVLMRSNLTGRYCR
jgi:hypothetical protein